MNFNRRSGEIKLNKYKKKIIEITTISEGNLNHIKCTKLISTRFKVKCSVGINKKLKKYLQSS